ncbi:MAG TPA: glycosyltransferase [Chthoniobacterales bacterium]|nr:glycosyltransferase [Chthoniobacterales bacterium]
MPDQDDHLRQLNAELDELRRSLVKLRAQLTLPAGQARPGQTVEAIHRHINALKTFARLLQSDAAILRARLEQAEREAWDQKVRRADATAKFKERERALEQIQRSISWKIIKPVWKVFNRSQRRLQETPVSDIAFTLDLPKRWKTNRELLLIKGWCFSRSGRQIAGVRVKVGKKTKLARYGLERPDVAESFREYPEASCCGFAVEIEVPPGTSAIKLETIEHGGQWQPFFDHNLERETNGDFPEEDLDFPLERPTERILKLSPLSANKAFELVRPGLQHHAARVASETPFFSVLTPVYNTKPEWLAEAALSLINQTFPDWEWCVVDDGSTDRETKKLLDLFATLSPRLRIASSPGKGISAATNHALASARGDYVCFLDHDDLLHPVALASMKEKLDEGYDVAYSDEDKLEDSSGQLVEPFFKPGWSPEYFRGVMYVGHLLCVKRELAQKVCFDSAYDGIQDFEFMLRLSEAGPRIGHVPEILYHWRKTPNSIAEKPDAKPRIGSLQEKAVNAHLKRVHLPGRAHQLELPHRLGILPAKRESHSRVSVIIPSRDAPKVLGRCLRSIFDKTSHPDFEVVLVDNDTTDPASISLMEQYPVRRVPFPGKFNFSRANNFGAQAATGELLVFLNNDTAVISDDWLQNLAYYAEQPEVGAAGALLIYEDRTVQHAGVTLGMRGTADHVMRGFPMTVDGYAGNLACAREVSVVTAACLMTRASVFQEIGGFSPHYFTAYQDVDLCLRLRTRGLRVICTPRACLLHDEFVSRPQSYYDMVDRMLLLDQWEEVIEKGDPYYNRNLDLERGDFSPRSRE